MKKEYTEIEIKDIRIFKKAARRIRGYDKKGNSSNTTIYSITELSPDKQEELMPGEWYRILSIENEKQERVIKSILEISYIHVK